jgi:transcriptional regulator with GAF, ATPase, and Fis domain
MGLAMRPACERCATTLAPDGTAFICTDECTFCADCAADRGGVCPNCGGELVARPRRGAAGAHPETGMGGAAAVTLRFEIARSLLGARDARQVAWRTVYSGLGALGVRSGAMFLADERGRYRRAATAGLGTPPATEALALPAAARDWIAERPVFALAGSGPARALGALRAQLIEHDAVIAAAIPGARGPTGLLVFGPPLIPGASASPDHAMLETLATLAGQALEPFAAGGAAGRDGDVPAPARDSRPLAALRETFPALRDMVGESHALLETCQDLASVAPTRFPVLLTGESGVGKELAALAVHQMSDRASGPTEVIDCGSIPAELIESELFGHVRGAFTGAQRDRRGAFELAHRGTLFLDEIGEMPLQLQTRLLRVLQEGRFRRVGDEKLIDVDVRVVAATNRDLAAEVAAKRFREDLYYRLNVFAVHLPALRERADDVGRLLDHFLTIQGRELGVRRWKVEPDVVAALEQYDWPGNVRELVNLCSALVVHARGTGVITPADLAHVWKRQYVGREAPWTDGAPAARGDLGDWVLEQARQTKFNLVELSRLLQRQKRAGQRVPVAERSALSYYLTGEILRALAESGGDTNAAIHALAREEELRVKVRARVRKVAESLTSSDSIEDARGHFTKIPAGYESSLEEAWRHMRG